MSIYKRTLVAFCIVFFNFLLALINISTRKLFVDFFVNKNDFPLVFCLTITIFRYILYYVDFFVNIRRIMPKNKEQVDALKLERKKEIALSGLKVFCERGYDGATVDDIVKKAKCSHGLFYHYFKSKKDIFDEVLKLHHERKNDDLNKLLSSTPKYVDKLRLILEHLFNELTSDETFAYYYYFFISQKFNLKEKGIRPPIPNDAPPPPFFVMEEFFEKGQKAGEFSDKYSAKDCARMFLAITQGSSIGYVVAPKEIQQKMKLPSIDFIIDIFLKGDVK